MSLPRKIRRLFYRLSGRFSYVSMNEYKRIKTEAFLSFQDIGEELATIRTRLQEEQATCLSLKEELKAANNALDEATQRLREEGEKRKQLEEELRALEKEISLERAKFKPSSDATNVSETTSGHIDPKEDTKQLPEFETLTTNKLDQLPVQPVPIEVEQLSGEKYLEDEQILSPVTGHRRYGALSEQSDNQLQELPQVPSEELNVRPTFHRDNIHPIYRGGSRRPAKDHEDNKTEEPQYSRNSQRTTDLFHLECRSDNWGDWYIVFVAEQQDVEFRGAVERHGQEGWKILSLDEPITITRHGHSEIEAISLVEQLELPLTFRLSGELQEGRRVSARTISNGTYLVIHEVDEEFEDIDPERMISVEVALPGCRGLQIDIDDKEDVSLLPLKQSNRPLQNAFELVGDILYNEEALILFCAPPVLKVCNLPEWHRVNLIVLGEEGPGRNRWRKEIRPQPNLLEQPLSPSLHHRLHGWYFLRFYGYDDTTQRWHRLYSDQFCFVSQVQAIEIDRSPLLSHNDKPISITFRHQEDCTITPINQAYVQGLTYENRVENELRVTTYRWTPSPALPKVSLDIQVDGFQTKITIGARRVWWAIASEQPNSEQWGTSIIGLSRSDLTPTSETKLWVKLSEERLTERVEVGFGQMRALPIGVEDLICDIPLRNFTDSVRYGAGVQSLRLKTPDGDQVTVAELKTLVRCVCCHVELSSHKQTIAHIKSQLTDGHEHLDYFFPPLTYDEIRKRQPSEFPLRIYQCLYCIKFTCKMHDNDPSAQNEMIDHVEKEHPGKPTRLRSINDSSVIREHVLHNLPDLRRCRICKKEFELSEIKTKGWQHLFKEHEYELWEVK